MSYNHNTTDENGLSTSREPASSAPELDHEIHALMRFSQSPESILADPRDGEFAGLFPCKASTTMGCLNGSEDSAIF